VLTIAPDRKFTTSHHGDGFHLLGGRLWLVTYAPISYQSWFPAGSR